KRSSAGIKVTSEIGKGSQFTLYLPKYHDQKTEELKPTYHTKSFTGSETILVVDDEEPLGNLASEILTAHGYLIFQVDGAAKAMDILDEQSVDLILTDIIMPEIDGYQLSAMVQSSYPGIKIQLVSGFTDETNGELVNDSLYKNILYKPYETEKLLNRVRDLLDN
ncbi:MAG: hybrid sensor histidine kinase/response regulator, partial [Gammaproteobacteria bacterium]